jgi:methionyl-tRNA formyltransferase
MKMDAGLDTGPILAQRAEMIRSDDTAATLTERLATLGASLLVDTLGPWASGQITPRPQDEAQATLTRPLKREDGLIAWSATAAATVARMVRAYDPWPGAYTHYAGRVLKLWQAEALDATVEAAPGHVLKRAEATPLLEALGLRWPQLLVVCREGVLLARRVQLEGRRPMAGDELMRGQPAVAGARLG